MAVATLCGREWKVKIRLRETGAVIRGGTKVLFITRLPNEIFGKCMLSWTLGMKI